MTKIEINIIYHKLDEFISKYYKNQLIKGGLLSLGFTVALFTVIALLEYFGQFKTTTRTVLFYTFIVSVGFVTWQYIIVPFTQLYKLRNGLTYHEAAKLIGRHFPEIKDKLLNTLQLANLEQNNSDLLLASISQRTLELKPLPFVSAVNYAENKKYLKYAAFPVLIIVSIISISPSVITDSTLRLVEYNRHFAKKPPFNFKLQNTDLKTVQHQDFEIKLRIEGNFLPDEININLDGFSYRMKKTNADEFSYIIRKVQKPADFYFETGEFTSDQFHLDVVKKPVILDFSVQLTYPAYTGKKNEQIFNTGDINVPEGTLAKWVFGTENADFLKIGFDDSVYTLQTRYGHNTALEKRLKVSSRYYLQTGNNGYNNPDTISYSINVIEDGYPTIQVENKKDSLNDKLLYFSGVIGDDYGFSALRFIYKFKNKRDSVHTVNDFNEKVTFRSASGSGSFFHVWNVKQLTLLPGDEIEYFFEVSDNDGVNGAKTTRSTVEVFKAPTKKELEEQKEKSNEEIKRALEESVVDARELQRDMKKFREKLADKKKLNWEEKKQLDELLQRQKKLEQELQEIANENEKAVQKQQEYEKPNEQLAEKQQMLQELFNQVMNDEMKQMYQQLQEMMEKIDKQQLQDMVEKMEFSAKDLEKELDRTMEMFKQLAVEQKMKETIEKLEELANKQEELSKEFEKENSNKDNIAKEQEKLNKEFNELKNDLDNLKKENQELEFPQEMAETAQEEEEISKEMQNASDQIQKNQNKNASKAQKQASEKMKNMAKKMEQQMEENEEEQAMEDMEDMRQLLENLLQLSFDQEKLMTELEPLQGRDPKFVAISQQQKKIKDDAKMIEDSLFALSKRVVQLEPTINKEMSAINRNISQSLDLINEAYTNVSYKPQATARQQQVMTSLNNLALIFDQALQDMQQQMKSNIEGKGSCKKPGSGSKPSAASMRKMQEQLNKQMKAMKEQLEKSGNKLGQKSGRGNPMSQELAKMAAQQEALRNEVKKLSQGMKQDKGSNGKGGLDELQKLMEQTETDLVNRRITNETLKRQQDILSRLLESEKAEREREFDEKREAREGKIDNFGNQNEFLEYNAMKKREEELLRTIPPSLTPHYKRLVNEYFNSLK